METTQNPAMAGDGGTPVAESPAVSSISSAADDIIVGAENILPEIRFLSFKNEGERFTGKYIGKKVHQEFDSQEFAEFLGADGNIYLAGQSKLLKIPDTYVGSIIVIVYRGKTTIKGGKSFNMFDVFALKS